MISRADIENEAAFIKHLTDATNPTGGKHTPTPWTAYADHSIARGDDHIAVFTHKADRDLALYFANSHAGMIAVMRTMAAAFEFIAGATAADDLGLNDFATRHAEQARIYADLFCRLGKIDEDAHP